MSSVGRIDDQQARIRWLAWGGIAGQVVFVGGWLILGAIEGHGFSAGRHDISDLGALTAHHAGLDRITLAVSGVLTVAFAVFALRSALRGPGGRVAISAWLVAFSLPALDNLSDVFFRLDCRAADAGCSTSDAVTSWHAKTHVIVFAVAAIVTLAAPFALARRMRNVEGWQDLARPTRNFGVVVVIGMVATAALQGTSGQGWSQRILATLVVAGVTVLAWRVRGLATMHPPAAVPAAS